VKLPKAAFALLSALLLAVSLTIVVTGTATADDAPITASVDIPASGLDEGVVDIDGDGRGDWDYGSGNHALIVGEFRDDGAQLRYVIPFDLGSLSSTQRGGAVAYLRLQSSSPRSSAVRGMTVVALEDVRDPDAPDYDSNPAAVVAEIDADELGGMKYVDVTDFIRESTARYVAFRVQIDYHSSGSSDVVKMATEDSTNPAARPSLLVGFDADPAEEPSPTSSPAPSPTSTTAASYTACPKFKVKKTNGFLDSAALMETSGLVASVRNPGLFWAHNDSGDSARVFLVDASGHVRGEYALSGATARDWEDIAVGPGPDASKSYVYVGDIGDNAGSRGSVQVYRFAEPAAPSAGYFSRSVSGVEQFDLRYAAISGSGTMSTDAEAMFVDPVDGSLYVMDKTLRTISGQSRRTAVWRVQANRLKASSSPIVMDYLVAVRGRISGSSNKGPVGADMSADGGLIVAKTYSEVFLWLRRPGESIASALGRAPCNSYSSGAEAIALMPGDAGYLAISEGARARVQRWPFAW
jgi:hypothetical protein